MPCHVTGRDDAGIGEARFLGGSPAALEDRDGVAVTGQLIRGGDADNSGANDSNFHESL